MNPALQNTLYDSLMGVTRDPNTVSAPFAHPGIGAGVGTYTNMSENYQPDVNGGGPISAGTMAAIRAKKNSVQMSPEEQRRAEGLAIQQFFANMAHSRNPDQLGRVNESITPALSTYLAHEQGVQNLNASLMEQEQKQRERAEDRALKREALSLRKSLKNSFENETLTEKLRAEGKIPKDAIMLKGLPSNQQLFHTKETSARVKRGLPAGNVINITNELDRIIDKYPHLSSDIINALVTSKPGSPGLIDIASLKLTNSPEAKKVRADIEIFNKLSNDLVIQSLGGVSGRMASDKYKELLTSTKPQLGLTKEAIKYVNKHIRNEQMHWYNDALANKKAQTGGYYIPDYIPDIHNSAIPAEGNNVTSNSEQSGQDIIGNIRAKYPKLNKYPDELIIKAIEEGKLK